MASQAKSLRISNIQIEVRRWGAYEGKACNIVTKGFGDQTEFSVGTGYFQVTFPGPGGNLDRIRAPLSAPGALVTPAVEAQLNERQRKMVSFLTAGEKLTSRRCEKEFDITRDTAARDFNLLMKLGLATKQGRGRSTSYVLATKS
jgi:ATP-dependent DNA helicase RecG